MFLYIDSFCTISIRYTWRSNQTVINVWILNVLELANCSWLVQACLDVCLPYVTEREQFGKKIGEFQVSVPHTCKVPLVSVANSLRHLMPPVEAPNRKAGQVDA